MTKTASSTATEVAWVPRAEARRLLILTLKPGENVSIGSHITLKLTEIRGFQAKLGVDAPRDVPVVREELLRRPGGKGRPA